MLSYEVDGQDRVVRIDGAWDEFASANDAPELVAASVRGTLLWDHVAGDETCQLYQGLFRRVRQMQSPALVPFRCDGPTVRRFLELEIRPGPDQSVSLDSRILREEPRAAAPLLGRSTARSRKMIVACSWCRRVAGPAGEWLEVEDAVSKLDLFDIMPLPQISHGICPNCLAALKN